MRKIVTLAVIALLGAARLAAQGAAPAADGYRDVRAAFKDLIQAEERYYSEHGTYTTDVAALGMPMPHSHADAMARTFGVTIVQAGGRGWWAQGDLRGERRGGCVVYVGEMKYFAIPPATSKGTAAGADQEARAVCDPS
jgi:hypothetical protein